MTPVIKTAYCICDVLLETLTGKRAHKEGIPTSESMIFVQTDKYGLLFSILLVCISNWSSKSLATKLHYLRPTAVLVNTQTRYITASSLFNLIDFPFIESKHWCTPNIISCHAEETLSGLDQLISTFTKTNSDLMRHFKMFYFVKAHPFPQSQPPSGMVCMISGALLIMGYISSFSDLAANVTALGEIQWKWRNTDSVFRS